MLSDFQFHPCKRRKSRIKRKDALRLLKGDVMPYACGFRGTCSVCLAVRFVRGYFCGMNGKSAWSIIAFPFFF